ncbi:hypothetical protein AB6A40_009888 [Gnathostoma spinigerum]|uniref:ubiquitinyl hydrolase 1 n=1 Tax=Gnathostoma spinigerum TaxID=75299 RepID=A0ABD6F0F8_9BILA
MKFSNSHNEDSHSPDDTVACELKKKLKNCPGPTDFYTVNNTMMSTSPENLLSFMRTKLDVAEDRKLRPPCSGIMATELRCCNQKCAYKKVRDDGFCVLSLTIPKSFSGMQISLESLMRKFFCVEYLPDASCDRCLAQKNSLKYGLMKKQGLLKFQLPPMLIIRIERVGCLPSGTLFKHSDYFPFPEVLDVRDFCFYKESIEEYKFTVHLASDIRPHVLGGSVSTSDVSNKDNLSAVNEQFPFSRSSSESFAHMMSDRPTNVKYKYQLRSVSVHIGQPTSGHFLTYRRGPSLRNENIWYRASDNEVTRVSYAEVAKAEAYMLFYEKIMKDLSRTVS